MKLIKENGWVLHVTYHYYKLRNNNCPNLYQQFRCTKEVLRKKKPTKKQQSEISKICPLNSADHTSYVIFVKSQFFNFVKLVNFGFSQRTQM